MRMLLNAMIISIPNYVQMKSFLVIFMINPFPLDTYNFLDDNDDYDKNNLSTPVENLFLDNKGAED